ncbi:Mitogen-activated protein kinase 6, partial [Clarias magur]
CVKQLLFLPHLTGHKNIPPSLSHRGRVIEAESQRQSHTSLSQRSRVTEEESHEAESHEAESQRQSHTRQSQSGRV